MTATQFLKREHNAVKRLFVELRRTQPRARRKRRELVERIRTELEIHAQIEEELFYPAVAERPEAHHVIAEARADHEAVRDVLGELEAVASTDASFGAKADELREIVLAHVTEEEDEVFPLADQLGADRLARLGAELDARKRELRERAPGRRTAA